MKVDISVNAKELTDEKNKLIKDRKRVIIYTCIEVLLVAILITCIMIRWNSYIEAQKLLPVFLYGIAIGLNLESLLISLDKISEIGRKEKNITEILIKASESDNGDVSILPGATMSVSNGVENEKEV